MTDFLSLTLSKAKAFGGPIVALGLLTGAGGWWLRGTAEAQSGLVADIRRLDTSTVKHTQLERVVYRLEAVAARQDSTNALLRRYICRESPTLCP